ncbi:unnamed protein product [Caenorhabditis brenneri]
MNTRSWFQVALGYGKTIRIKTYMLRSVCIYNSLLIGNQQLKCSGVSQDVKIIQLVPTIDASNIITQLPAGGARVGPIPRSYSEKKLSEIKTMIQSPGSAATLLP